MGFVFENHGRGIECFQICDNCKFTVNEIPVCTTSISAITDYMRKNKWFKIDGTRENNYKRKEYCHSCAIALGYIKD